MTDTVKIALDLFVKNMRQQNIACVDETERFAVYSVRTPSPRLEDDDLNALGRDDEFGVELAAWLKVRAAWVRRS